MLTAIKNQSVRVFLNQYLAGIGELRELAINRDQKEIVAKLSLEGETTLIELRALEYRFTDEGLVFVQFACERAWAATALNRWVANRVFVVPEGVVRSALMAVL